MPRGGFRAGSGRPKKGEIRIKPVRIKQVTQPVARQCAHCGETYTSGRTKYCSRGCCVAANHKKQNSFPHTCERCGQNFTSNYHAKYCSDDCYRNKHRRITAEGISEKRCPKCGDWKPLTEEYYYRSNQTSDGFYGHCKPCSAKAGSLRSKTQHGKELRRFARARNIETEREYRKKRQPVINERARIKSKTDPSFSLNRRMRCLMWAGLKKNKSGRSWQDLAGYSIDDLRRHIEKQFKGGMSWNHFLSGEIHIDHRIPRAAFNYSCPEDPDFKKCWSLKNLQPLWAFDNMSKGDRIEAPFQPSLTIGG